MSGPIRPFKPSHNGSGWGVQPIGPRGDLRDLHETFKVDKYGNISGGHDTVYIPGYKPRPIPWDKK